MTVASALPRSAAIGVGAAVAVAAAGWLALAAVGPPDLAAIAPVAAASLAAGGLLLAAAALGRPVGVAAILLLVVLGLSVSFRERAYGDTGLDLQNGLKAAIWLLVPVLALANLRRLAPLARDPALMLAVAFGATAMASALWSPTPAYTAASGLGVLSYALLAALAMRVLGEIGTLRLVVIALAAFAVLALASGIALPARAWISGVETGGPLRLQGLSGHPNVLGEQMALLITLAVVARREGAIERPFFLACLALGFAALLATSSRTTLLAVLGAWAIVALRTRGLLALAVVGVVAAAAAAAALTAFGLSSTFEPALALVSRSGSLEEVLTFTGRTDLWAVSLDLFHERPLLGWGFNGTEALLVDSVGRAFWGDPVNAHNMALQGLVSLGVLGVLPGFLLFGVLLARMVAAPDPGRDQVVLLALIIGLAEVAVFATPMLLTLSLFLFVARDACRATRPSGVHIA